MYPDRYRPIQESRAEIDREFADLYTGKVVAGWDPATREAELLDEQDALVFELGEDNFRNRRE